MLESLRSIHSCSFLFWYKNTEQLTLWVFLDQNDLGQAVSCKRKKKIAAQSQVIENHAVCWGRPDQILIQNGTRRSRSLGLACPSDRDSERSELSAEIVHRQ